MQDRDLLQVLIVAKSHRPTSSVARAETLLRYVVLAEDAMVFQLLPSQCIISGVPYMSPTAQTSVLLTAETP
jgi:hypothetical protein